MRGVGGHPEQGGHPVVVQYFLTSNPKCEKVMIYKKWYKSG